MVWLGGVCCGWGKAESVDGLTEGPEHVGGGAPPIFLSSIKKNGWIGGPKMGNIGWVRHGVMTPKNKPRKSGRGAPSNETTFNFTPKT